MKTKQKKTPSANLEVVKNLVLSLLAARVKREILFVINLYLDTNEAGRSFRISELFHGSEF